MLNLSEKIQNGGLKIRVAPLDCKCLNQSRCILLKNLAIGQHMKANTLSTQAYIAIETDMLRQLLWKFSFEFLPKNSIIDHVA